ncbi:MAG: DUF1254 domain-containing protein [Burkholderiales bacterium]
METPAAPATLDALVADASVYAFAVHDLARTRWNATQNEANPARFDVNTLSHARRLLDHRDRWITMPNNDTLYSIAWIDLSAGPVTFAYPAMGERYYSFAFLDPWTENAALVSRRTHGGDARTLWLAPPDWAGEAPAGVTALRMAANDVWLLGRVLIDGAPDLPAVFALQEAMRLDAPAGAARRWATVPDERDPRSFLALANEALGRNPVPARDAALLERCAAVGLAPGAVDAWATLAEPVREAWVRGMAELRQRLRPGDPARRSQVGPNWYSGLDHIGRFGEDHGYRSMISLLGLGALPREEAIYATCAQTADGTRLEGATPCTLTVPADLPVGAFWSLSMYRMEPDGRGFYVDNPIDRYTIGDRTTGIEREADGSLVIRLQHDAPADARGRANWLPAPEGRYVLNWRLYEPGASLIDRSRPLPGVVRA